MSKYGYTKGYDRVAEVNRNRDIDPESSEYHTLRKKKEAYERSKQNFDKRFGSPVFQAAKKRKWYQFSFVRSYPTLAASIGGVAGTCIFYYCLFSSVRKQQPTAEQEAERDILIRKAFGYYGDRWYAYFLPYYSRWKQLQLEDHKQQQRLAAAATVEEQQD